MKHQKIRKLLETNLELSLGILKDRLLIGDISIQAQQLANTAHRALQMLEIISTDTIDFSDEIVKN